MERDGVIMKLRRFLLMGLCLVFLFTAFTGCTPKQTTQTPLEFYTAYMKTAKNGSPEEIASYLYFPNEEEKQFHMASFAETEGDNYESYEITETKQINDCLTAVYLHVVMSNDRESEGWNIIAAWEDGHYSIVLNPREVPASLSEVVDLSPYYHPNDLEITPDDLI